MKAISFHDYAVTGARPLVRYHVGPRRRSPFGHGRTERRRGKIAVRILSARGNGFASYGIGGPAQPATALRETASPGQSTRPHRDGIATALIAASYHGGFEFNRACFLVDEGRQVQALCLCEHELDHTKELAEAAEIVRSLRFTAAPNKFSVLVPMRS